jgi:tetratricopeptide (TPR) repeat protein
MKSDTIRFKNYQKWDLYESSSDEEQKAEPILPRNDPNFIALEKDMIESQKNREASRKKAIQLKEEGNNALKESKFKKAIRLYTEAINECRGMMLLYTNRALAFIKREDYASAITDCDKVIEYLEVFEEELKANKEIYVKALTRKAIALQKIKDYVEAKELVTKALQVLPDPEMTKLIEALQLEENIHKKSLEEIKGDAQQFETLDKFINHMKKLSNDSISICSKDEMEKVKITLKIAECNKYYFIQKGGLELTSSFIEKYPSLLEIINIFNQDKAFTLLLNNMKIFNKLIQILSRPLDDKLTMSNSDVQILLGILEDASQQEEVRKSLSVAKNLDKLFLAALDQFNISKKEVINNSQSVITLMRLFTFVCNLNYSSNSVRENFVKLHKEIFDKIFKFIEIYDFTNSLNNNLLESILSFLINLSCDQTFRDLLEHHKNFLSFLIINLRKIKSFNVKKYEDVLERSLALLFNTSFKDNLNHYYIGEKLDLIFEEYVCNCFDIVETNNLQSLSRVLMLEVKLTKSGSLRKNSFMYYKKIANITNLSFLKKNMKIIDNSIKIFAHLLNKEEFKSESEGNQVVELLNLFCDTKDFVSNLCSILLEDSKNYESNLERIVNNLSLLISLVGKDTNLAKEMKNIISLIISFAKDKLDLPRKNSAILLAKIAKADNEMQEYVRSLHGMDVLLSVAKFINTKK